MEFTAPWFIAAALLAVAACVLGAVLLLRRTEEDAPAFDAPERPQATPSPADTAGAVATGSLKLRGGTRFPGGVTLDGDLEVEEGAEVDGPVRVKGTAILDARAGVEGSLLVDGDAHLRAQAHARTLKVAGDTTLDEHAVVEEQITCRRLHVKPAGDVKATQESAARERAEASGESDASASA